MAGTDDPVCPAAGLVWHIDSGGRVAPTAWSQPVRCARPAGHPLPHATSPDPAPLPVFGASRVRRWAWWQWPAPPPAEPTSHDRWHARGQQLAAALLLLLAVLGWLVLGVASRT